MSDYDKTHHDDRWITSDFVSAVLEQGKSLVSEHQFQQMPPAILLGGREVSVEYASDDVNLTFFFESGSPPSVIVKNLKLKQRHGLFGLIKLRSPERADRIEKLWYQSRRSAPPMEDIVKEYVDFLRSEGTAVLSADFTDWPND